MEINNNHVSSTQFGYEDDIQKMVIDSMDIVDEIYEPNDNEREIINKDNQYRNKGIIDETHRYHLRPTISDWKNRYAGEYSAPVVLSNLSIPKAIRLYGVEAVASIMKEIGQLQDKGCGHLSSIII